MIADYMQFFGMIDRSIDPPMRITSTEHNNIPLINKTNAVNKGSRNKPGCAMSVRFRYYRRCHDEAIIFIAGRTTVRNYGHLKMAATTVLGFEKINIYLNDFKGMFLGLFSFK